PDLGVCDFGKADEKREHERARENSKGHAARARQFPAGAAAAQACALVSLLSRTTRSRELDALEPASESPTPMQYRALGLSAAVALIAACSAESQQPTGMQSVAGAGAGGGGVTILGGTAGVVGTLGGDAGAQTSGTGGAGQAGAATGGVAGSA